METSVGNRAATPNSESNSAASGINGNERKQPLPPITFLADEQAQTRLDMIRSYVAKPIPRSENWRDPHPAMIDDTGILIGNRHHASRVEDLVQRGVTAVLNCASGGISRLPMDELQHEGIMYEFTNVRQDDLLYPILFDRKTAEPSQHLQIAKALYAKVRKAGGRVMFFCVAGQNRCVF